MTSFRITNNQAVSPAVGVVLLVAITVMLAAVVGVAVLDFQPASNSNVQGGFSISENPADGELTVQLTTDSNADHYVVQSGDDQQTLSTVGESVTISTDSTVSIIAVKDGSETLIQSYPADNILSYPAPWVSTYGGINNHAFADQTGPQTLSTEWSVSGGGIPEVAAEGVVYTRQRSSIRAYTIDDGTHLWATPIEISHSEVTYNDGRLFIAGHELLTVLDATDGSVLWEVSRTDDYLGKTAVTVHDGTVYSPSNRNYLYAYDAETGEELWKSYAGSSSLYDNPVYSDGIIYQSLFKGDGRGLVAIDAETGDRLWFSGPVDHPRHGVLFDDEVLSTTGYGFVYGFDAKSGTPTWEHQLFESSQPLIAITGDTMYAVEQGKNHIVSYDLTTNTVNWNRSTLPGPSFHKELPVIAGDVMYIPTYDYDTGEAGFHAIDTADGSLISSHEFVGHPSESVPYGDAIFIKTDQGLQKLSAE